MDSRQIIVQEIKKWRDSQLLPEQYCDFLLNLYRDEDEMAATKATFASGQRWAPARIAVWMVIISCLTIYVSVMYYFSEFSLQMQLVLPAIIVIILYATGFFAQNRQQTASYVAFGAGSALLLMSGPLVLDSYGVAPHGILAHVLGCSLIWIVLGHVFRIGLLQFCGWSALFLCYGWWAETRFFPYTWMTIQLIWLPMTVLSALITLWVKRWKTSARVFFGLSLIAWMAPELQMLLAEAGRPTFSGVAAVVKTAVVVTGLYVTRTRWTEWIK